MSLPDIYFTREYGTLNEQVEKGTAKEFYSTSKYGIVKHQFMIREIPISIDNNTYYDLITPYGYGGPVILECTPGKEKELVKKFCLEFGSYCKKDNIISEFVRFHPIIENADYFKDIYDINIIRNTLGTNLKKYDDPFQSEFSRSARKKVRQSLKKGLTYEIIECPEDLGDFKKIYYATMKRNKADDFYYFGDDYFNKVLDLFRNNIIVVKVNYKGVTIAQGLYFIYNKTIHIHLSGTLSEYIELSPAYILRYAATLWGKENGYELIHHGGGRSNSVDDSLYQFKKRFAQNTEYNFKVGKKVWNRRVYTLLCEKLAIDETIDFFPAYRKGK